MLVGRKNGDLIAGIRADEVLEWQPTEITWRVHRTTGPHILPWHELRTFGPILRFDHHPVPRDEHPDYGIWYGASSPRGALAEAFQSARIIDRHRGDPYLTGLRFTRPLRLLDVSGIGGAAWVTRVGGNHALDSAPHGRSQHWARTIHRAHPDVEGTRLAPWGSGSRYEKCSPTPVSSVCWFHKRANVFAALPKAAHPGGCRR